MKAVVTVIGGDRVGIIARISGVMLDKNINILDINQTIMGGDVFTMMMLVDMSAMTCSFEEFKDALAMLGEQMGVSVRVAREEIFRSMHRI